MHRDLAEQFYKPLFLFSTMKSFCPLLTSGNPEILLRTDSVAFCLDRIMLFSTISSDKNRVRELFVRSWKA